MKKLLLILSMGFAVLEVCLTLSLTNIWYELRGGYYDGTGRYLQSWLVVLIVLSFLIELYIIFKKDE